MFFFYNIRSIKIIYDLALNLVSLKVTIKQKHKVVAFIKQFHFVGEKINETLENKGELTNNSRYVTKFIISNAIEINLNLNIINQTQTTIFIIIIIILLLYIL